MPIEYTVYIVMLMALIILMQQLRLNYFRKKSDKWYNAQEELICMMLSKKMPDRAELKEMLDARF
jgi:hypothetical protein